MRKKLHRSGKNFTVDGKTSPPWKKLHRLLRSFLMKFFQAPCKFLASVNWNLKFESYSALSDYEDGPKGPESGHHELTKDDQSCQIMPEIVSKFCVWLVPIRVFVKDFSFWAIQTKRIVIPLSIGHAFHFDKLTWIISFIVFIALYVSENVFRVEIKEQKWPLRVWSSFSRCS